MTFGELKRQLTEIGCSVLRDGAKHEIWRSPVTGKQFPVGRHNKKEVPTGTLKSIKKSAGLK